MILPKLEGERSPSNWANPDCIARIGEPIIADAAAVREVVMSGVATTREAPIRAVRVNDCN